VGAFHWQSIKVNRVCEAHLNFNLSSCFLLQKVIEVTKKYLPFMAKGFESPKLHVHIGDGFHFVKEHLAQFDVIITDSSDPVGT